MTLVQSAEWARYGVTANAIAPAARTRMTEEVFAQTMAAPAEGEFDAMAPENVSPFVVWLGSVDSAGVTGRVFEVEGGKISVADGWQHGDVVDKGARWEPARRRARRARAARQGASTRRRCTAPPEGPRTVYERRSTTMAMPWPPPTHMLSRPKRLVGVLEAVDQCGHDAGAGHAERVTERDRAAVDVELLPRDAEVAWPTGSPARRRPR